MMERELCVSIRGGSMESNPKRHGPDVKATNQSPSVPVARTLYRPRQQERQ
jgi:hypothetical protein